MSKKSFWKPVVKVSLLLVCALAVLFLLLPFLQAPNTAKEGSSTQAVPQIFTSNPLTDLAHTIYNMLAGRRSAKTHANAGQLAAASWASDATGNTLQQRYSAEKTNASTQNAAGTAGQGHSFKSVAEDTSEGQEEWVLVHQTAPEAAERGMHDIKVSDTPYDRYVRMREAQAHAASSQTDQQEIPDSRWARLWQPVKQLFGLGQEGDSISPSSRPDKAQLPQNWQLASAAGRKNASRAPNTSSNQSAIPGWFGGQSYGWPASIEEDSLISILMPERAADSVTEAILQQAEKTLNKQEMDRLRKQLEDTKRQALTEAKQNFQNKLEQLVAGQQEENLVPKTISSCAKGSEGGSGGTYDKNDWCGLERPEKPPQALVDQLHQQRKAELEQYIGLTRPLPDAPKILVFLGTTDQIDLPPEHSIEAADEDADTQALQRANQMSKQFYDFMLAQKGCQDQRCYWVGNAVQPGNPRLRNSIEAAGLDFLGDPNGVFQDMAKQYMEYLLDAPETDETTQAIIDFQTYPLNIGYVPYTESEWKELNQRNSVDNLKHNPKDGFFTFGPAQQLAEHLEVLPNPGLVIADPTNEILDHGVITDDLDERALRFQILAKERIDEYKEIQRKLGQTINELGLAELAKQQINETLQEIRDQSQHGQKPTGMDTQGNLQYK